MLNPTTETTITHETFPDGTVIKNPSTNTYPIHTPPEIPKRSKHRGNIIIINCTIVNSSKSSTLMVIAQVLNLITSIVIYFLSFVIVILFLDRSGADSSESAHLIPPVSSTGGRRGTRNSKNLQLTTSSEPGGVQRTQSHPVSSNQTNLPFKDVHLAYEVKKLM